MHATCPSLLFSFNWSPEEYSVRSTCSSSSFFCLYYHRSTVFSKVGSPHSALFCFLVKFPLSCLFLKVWNLWNQKCINKGVKSRSISENTCYHSVQNLFLPVCYPRYKD
jgi:hypothetical protein